MDFNDINNIAIHYPNQLNKAFTTLVLMINNELDKIDKITKENNECGQYDVGLGSSKNISFNNKQLFKFILLYTRSYNKNYNEFHTLFLRKLIVQFQILYLNGSRLAMESECNVLPSLNALHSKRDLLGSSISILEGNQSQACIFAIVNRPIIICLNLFKFVMHAILNLDLISNDSTRH